MYAASPGRSNNWATGFLARTCSFRAKFRSARVSALPRRSRWRRALALLGASGRRKDLTTIARLCQRAENEYVGMQCGIMDQLVACFGKKDHAILIDCRTLETTPVPLDGAKVGVVVANTMAKHALVSSEYNRRRAECEEAVRRIRARRTIGEDLARCDLGGNREGVRELAGRDPAPRAARHHGDRARTGCGVGAAGGAI